MLGGFKSLLMKKVDGRMLSPSVCEKNNKVSIIFIDII